MKASFGNNNSVLVSAKSQLIALIDIRHKNELVTIDTDNIVRIWNMHTGICKLSYSLDF